MYKCYLKILHRDLANLLRMKDEPIMFKQLRSGRDLEKYEVTVLIGIWHYVR